ncbi:MAG: hypothetical protein QNK20_05140 [Aureibaculum sp.]|nr:hypothetical protein [Aureibaculum sp.]
MPDDNLVYTKEELQQIRSLPDHDLIMFLNELEEYEILSALDLLATQIKLKQEGKL